LQPTAGGGVCGRHGSGRTVGLTLHSSDIIVNRVRHDSTAAATEHLFA